MGRAELSQKTIQVVLGLILSNSVLGLCPPRWIPYKEELCLYVADGPALSWSEARIFCQDQRAELVVIKNYNKQPHDAFMHLLEFPHLFYDVSDEPYRWCQKTRFSLLDRVDVARGKSSAYLGGCNSSITELVQNASDFELFCFISNWLQGHPKKGRCVQLVGFYSSQWRDWDCSANSSFICEIPARDAFPGSVRKVRFSSYCYTFHFPSFREVRSWREAQALCQESGENLVTIRNEEDNAFLSYAFPLDGWYMWIGLRFGTAWKWSDSSFPVYFRWHPDEAPIKKLDQCAVLSFQPDDNARHGTWKTRSCNAHPTSEATGFICQHKHDFCGPPEPVEFPLPGGMGPYTTADVVFTLPAQSTCSFSLIGWDAYTTPFQLSLVSDATHVHGSVVAELGNISVYKNVPRVPFSPGLNTWSFITFPDGIASFFNHREHFRLSDAQDISFANLSSLQMSGVTVANASLEYRLSSDLHFPGGSSLQLENAISCYLGNFTIGLWVRSSFTLSPKMCLISYSLKWRPLEFALFLLSPSGLEFHVKGAVMFSGTSGCLLDGSWHHVAVSVSSIPSAIPFQVFVDGESWELDYSDVTSFLHKGLSLGGKLSVGQLEVDNRGTRFYVGDLSEVNLWDRALSELSVKQLAASKTKWKYPGNVVSWSQLLAKRPVTMQISIPDEDPDAAFVWFGLLQLRGRSSVLCTDPERSQVYIEPTPELCFKHAFWGLQLNGRIRNIADPSSCLLVAPDGVSLLSNSNCYTDAKSSFRLLPDQRLQNLNSGFCLFQEVISTKLYLQKCTSEALYFALDSDVHCPLSRGWIDRKDKCFFFVLNVALEWQQALKFCQRFLDGSLVVLNSLQEQAWLKNKLSVSVWTGLHSSVEGSLSWANGTPLNKALQRFIFSQGASNMKSCMLALTSGYLKAESCQRPHRWICQTPRQSDLYMTFQGKSFYGAWTADVTFSSLSAAKQQCTSLGRGCNMVVSTAAGHRLGVGTRFAMLEETAADPEAAVHVKSKCFPGYSGEDCQSMCPRCEPGVSCNPLTGLCDGFLYYREALAVYTSLKCLPFGNWVFEHGSCVTLERYSSREEAESICRRYLGAEVWKAQYPLHVVPIGFSGAERRGLETKDFLWACQRPEDVELPSFKEKLLISLQDAAWPQKRASLQEAKDACYLQKEHCTGVLSLHGAYYMVTGTVLVDCPGSGAILYVKSACSAGFCGDKCQKHCPPVCLSGRTYNPLTGKCDGLLSCVRRFSPSCLHGLVSSRCPHHPGWWFWDGHCYYVEEHSSKSWKGAKAACEAYGKDVALLTLTSAKEKAWIMAMVQKESWTGLNDVDKDGIWTWAEGQTADSSASWLADVQLMSGGCLGIGPQGEQNMAVSSCSEVKPWVCKAIVSPQSSCPTEPGWRPWNGSCYFWDSSLVRGWHEALQVCQRFRNTELLYLTSLQEKEWVSSNFGGSFWTGLNDLKDESVFWWTTQEPLSQPLAQYLHDNMADGGLKDCVWFDTVTGFLIDANCKEKRPFLCKCNEATDWFDKQSGRGAAGDLELLYPSMESLEQAKQECLLARSACVAVLQTDKGFYLISSAEDIISKPDSTLYTWSICAKGFSGPRCHKALTSPPPPACDCSGRFQTTAKKVCGIPVQSCVDDCLQMTPWKNCSLCLPECTGKCCTLHWYEGPFHCLWSTYLTQQTMESAEQTLPFLLQPTEPPLFVPGGSVDPQEQHREASLSNLDPEELALITMIQFRVSHSLNLTTEDERDRGNSSKIIYDPRYP